MARTALIVIDMQRAFITSKAKHLPQKIKAHIERSNYDSIIFSKFINAENSNFARKLDWHKCRKSPDIDIAPELSEIANRNHIFEKHTYSIFKAKGFVDFLRKNKISKLCLCGLDLDACILASAFEAFDLGFDCEVLFGLVGSSANADIHKSAERVIRKNLQQTPQH